MFRIKKYYWIIQIVASTVLIFLVIKKVDLVLIVKYIIKTPVWFVSLMVLNNTFSSIGSSYRWALIVLNKPKVSDIVVFFRAQISGQFLSLIIPGSMGGDMFKWLPLTSKYPELSKSKIASSVLIDRIVGLTVFVIFAFINVLIGKLLKINFPTYIFWLFLFAFLMVICFFVLVFYFDIYEKIKNDKLRSALSSFDKGNKGALLKAFLVTFMLSPLWTITPWFYFLIYGCNIDVFKSIIIMPVINLLLLLPISFAGFGAKENLFLYFFSSGDVNPSKLISASAMQNVIQILTVTVLYIVFYMIDICKYGYNSKKIKN